MSCRVRVSSSASGPLPFFPARAMADSNPSPASTAMVIWSRVSASSRPIASCRSCPRLYSRSSGTKYATPVTTAASSTVSAPGCDVTTSRPSSPAPSASTSLAATSFDTGHSAGRPALPASRLRPATGPAGGTARVAGEPVEAGHRPGRGQAGRGPAEQRRAGPAPVALTVQVDATYQVVARLVGRRLRPGEQRPPQQREGNDDRERGRQHGNGDGAHQNRIFTVLLSQSPPTVIMTTATASIP